MWNALTRRRLEVAVVVVYLDFCEAVPMLVLFAFVANRRELTVSLACSGCGEMLTNIRVLELPTKLFCNSFVRRESLRKRTNCYLSSQLSR